jgi:twitching motility protein PilT
MSSVHTVDAGQTVNRIVGMFEQEEEKQIRIRLAETLRWVVCQRLLPRVETDRVAAFEIMGSNLRVKDSILHGESEGKTFYEIIEGSQPFGMMTFDQSISELYKEGLITEQTALSYASRKSITSRAIDAIKSARGEKTTSIEDLSIDRDYGKKR